MAVINSGMRKVIKGMAVTAQTAQFISLMPKPKDFVTRLVGDVVYLSTKVQKLSDDINKLLDQYANIPTDYLMTQMSSITNSATSIVNRVTDYSDNAVEQTLGVATNTLDTVSSLTDLAIDTVSSASKAVTSLGLTVAGTTSAILGNEDLATELHDASETILEWTDDGFKSVKSSTTDKVKNAAQSVENAKQNVQNKINSAASTVNSIISEPQKQVEQLLSKLKSYMDKLSTTLDSGFKDVTGVNSISKGSSYVTEALNDTDNKTEATQVTQAVTKSVQKVLDNFSISKVILAFGGVLTETVLVKTGLNELPPIDFESMITKISSENKKSNSDLYAELNTITDSTYSDIINFGNSISKIPSDERNYDMTKYKEYISQYNDDIVKQREEIRLAMKSREKSKLTPLQEQVERKKLKSAIKEVRKFKKKIKNARKSSKLIDIINEQLDILRNEANYKCNSIKSDWNDMMKQYKNAISEITNFFKNGGDGDKYIDDICDKINKDCDEIKELCTNLSTQLIACTIKVATPPAIGLCSPNPVYSLASFWMDIKTIFKFIKDLITLVIDIMNNVNKLARIMLNGINNLNEIIQQLFSMLGLQWFFDLIQSIIDMFGGKISDARELLANMVSPVYYEDTDEYENTLEILESMFSDDGTSTLTNDQIVELTDESTRFYALDSSTLKKAANGNEDKFQDLMDDLDDAADDLVAYKSPILAPSDNTEDNSSVTVSGLMNGTSVLDSDIKFIGWIFYHPNLDYKGSKYYQSGLFAKLRRKIKSKIIKKASKTSNKKRGGVNMLKRKKVQKDTAYQAFYWYTYYTEDLEEDGFDQTTAQDAIKINSTISTDNGTIVELTDGRKVFVSDTMVKSGDYVTVEGVKYRVK